MACPTSHTINCKCDIMFVRVGHDSTVRHDSTDVLILSGLYTNSLFEACGAILVSYVCLVLQKECFSEHSRNYVPRLPL